MASSRVGAKNQCPAGSGFAVFPRFIEEFAENRGEERGGFARASLRLAGSVAALKQERQGFSLDRGTVFKPHFLQPE